MRLAWLNNQWNEPTRTDHYLMQIAQEVRKTRFRKIESIKRILLEHFRIPFKFAKKGEDPAEAKTKKVEPKSGELPAVNQMWIATVGGLKKDG